VGLRVFVGNRSAIVSGSDMKPQALQKLARQAVAMAKAAPEDAFAGLAPRELLAHTSPDLDLDDAQEPSEPWLQEQCGAAEEAGLAVPGVTNSEGAEAAYGRSVITLATSEGFAHGYASSRFSVSMAAVAGQGTGMERDYDFGQSHHRADLPSAREIGKKAGERAVRRLHARKPATQRVPVVFDPRVSRLLIANFGHAINGAAVARGTSFLKDHLHKTVFAPGVRIVDDPLRVRGLASRPFDAEGVATARHSLVEDGVLVSWLLDARAARQLNMQTTGHASRGVSSAPSPAPTNLYLEAGAVSPQTLIGDIGSGFYVTETFGGGGNIVTGDYSAGASGFWIENGAIAFAVNEVTVAGKLSEMFHRMAPADDLRFERGTNAPTVRIDGLTVAGA
jgi:PmbA protein